MSSLKLQTISGLFWASLGSLGNGLLNILVIAILARILVPADFGILELIVVVTSISTVIIDSGFSQALIRDKHATNKDKSTVFYINIGISTTLYFILFFAAPFLSRFFNIEQFDAFCRVAFLSIIFDSLSIIQNTNFTKELQFRPIAVATLTSIFLAGIFAVFLAHIGWGVWALIWMIVLNSIIKTIMLWLMSSWRPTIVFCKTSMKKYWKFGSFILIQSIIDKMALDLESLVIGKFYTKTQLGFFSQSRKINSYFCHALTNVVVKVTYPALVKIGDSDLQLKNGYRKIVGQTTFFVSPIMVFIFFFPYLSMMALFGEQWYEAGEYLRIWACIGFIMPIQSICNNIFLVKGKSRQLFQISLFKNALKILVVLILAPFGIFAMLIGIMIVAITVAFFFLFFSGKLIRYNLWEVMSDVSKNILLSILACLPVSYLIPFISPYIPSNIIKLVLCFIIVMTIYVTLCFVLRNPNMRELISITKNIFHK